MNIALVLSGGMGKGAYQIGALKAIQDYLPPSEISYVSCASVGVLNGYAYATNLIESAEKMWLDICGSFSRVSISHVLRDKILQKNIDDICREEAAFPMIFYCDLLDTASRTLVYKDLSKVSSENIPHYLKAGITLPVFSRPVLVEGRTYFDGAMIDNIPVFPLLKHHLDYIICIYFDDICYKFENQYFDNKIIKITFPDQGLLAQSLFLSKDNIQRMIQNGYEQTERLLECVFAKGTDDLEYIYRMTEMINQNTKRRLRITGDLLVTNLNKITRRLTKYE